MQVGICISRKIVINGQVDTLNVYATAKDVGCDTDALVEFLEFFVALDARTASDSSLASMKRTLTVPLDSHQNGQRYLGSCILGGVCLIQWREGYSSQR